MGTTNWGTQTITFDFKQEGTAKGFNKLNYKLFPKGVYEGGLLTKKDANTVTIAPLTCFIEDSAVGLGVRIETIESVDKVITEATPYVILRFAWTDVEINYMDFFCKAVGDLLSTDIILGKGNYIGGALQSTFLYDERDKGLRTDQISAIDIPITDNNGRIIATEVENAIQEIAGAGRTIETVKQNQDDIDSLEGAGRTTETVKQNQDDIDSLEGAGRTTETVKENKDLIDAGGINDIINGSFDFWQRGTSFAAIVTGAYNGDRFVYTKVGTMVHTITRDTDVPGTSPYDINYSMKIDCTTIDATIAAGDLCTIGQKIEGYNFKKYVGGYGILSFWVKGTKTGVHCVSFRNSVADRSYVVEYSINTTNTWEFKTITVPLNYSGGTWDYVNGIGLEISWALATGSTFQTTPGIWQAGNYFGTTNQVNTCDNTSNDFRLAKVKFELGQVVTPFVMPDYENELARCQRYFEKSHNIDVAPTTIATAGRLGFNTTGTVNAAYTIGISCKYKVRKRITAPTVVAYSSITATPDRVRLPAGDVVATYTVSGEWGVQVSGIQVNPNPAKSIYFQFTSDAEL